MLFAIELNYSMLKLNRAIEGWKQMVMGQIKSNLSHAWYIFLRGMLKGCSTQQHQRTDKHEKRTKQLLQYALSSKTGGGEGLTMAEFITIWYEWICPYNKDRDTRLYLINQHPLRYTYILILTSHSNKDVGIQKRPKALTSWQLLFFGIQLARCTKWP